MDVQRPQVTAGFSLRRFFAREFFCGAESRGTAALYSALSFALSLLFARTHALFGAYPFALAFLAAADRRLPFAFAGACIGALTLGERGYVYAVAYLLLILLRALISRPREEGRFFPACAEFFEEEGPLRAAACCVCGCFLSLYQLLVGGMAFASLAFAGTMLLLPVGACGLYMMYFSCGLSPYRILTEEASPVGARPTRTDWQTAIGVAAIGFTLLLGAGDSALFGVSLSLCLAAFFCTFFPIQWGVLRGGVTAFLIACGTLDPLYFPAYAVLAVLCGLLRRLGLPYALIAGSIGSVLTAYAVCGAPAIVNFMPEILVSAALTWPLFRYLPDIAAWPEQSRQRALAASAAAVRAERPSVQRMEQLSAAYTSLSEIFSRLSASAVRPSEAEYREACRAVFDRHCTGCAGACGCWEMGEKNAERALACLSEQYARGTPPTDIRVPDSLMRACGCFPRMREEVRDACATLEESKRRSEKNGVLALNYATTAEILSDAAAAVVREERDDPALGRAAARIFAEAGVAVRRVSVLGVRKRTVLAEGVKWRAERDREDALRAPLEELLHCDLCEAVFESRDNELCMRFDSRAHFTFSVHTASAAQGREVSGDAFSTFDGQGEYAYALLSDGMGSGREAAVTAGICGAFLRQTLSAGCGKNSALRALNQVLCARGVECSATIDLLELDLLYGKACFVKSGAAASYVKRGDNLFRIRSSTVPIGILQALDAEKIRFDMQVGDVVIMLSDGVSQTPEDAAWLCELLSGNLDGDGDAMAEKLLNAARSHTSGGDDMTVALLEIKEACA